MSFKKYTAVAAIGAALITAPAHAGGLAEPIVEAEVIAEETTASGGFVIPLLLLAIIVAAASSSGGSSSPPPVTF